jgi:hypothetical protein
MPAPHFTPVDINDNVITSESGSARTVALTGSSQIVSNTPADYRGFGVRETAGATAVLRIYDNASAASGVLLDVVSLVANESARELYPGAIHASNGVYVQVVSGTIEGSVRLV